MQTITTIATFSIPFGTPSNRQRGLRTFGGTDDVGLCASKAGPRSQKSTPVISKDENKNLVPDDRFRCHGQNYRSSCAVL
jgi:hypothetical protein